MKYLNEYMQEHGWSWVEMQKQYILNPKQFRDDDMEMQLLAQSGSDAFGAAALMICADRLDQIINRLDKKL